MIKISTINYDGAIPRSEGDEFIELVNEGKDAVDISRWVVSAGPASATNSQTFEFPDGTSLAPGAKVRVYTDKDPSWEGFSFDAHTAIWGNKAGTGTLFDAKGETVDSYTYPLEKPDLWVFSTLLPGGDGVHDFGARVLGSAQVTATFTIENRRPDRDLVLDGSPAVTLASGAPAFVIESQPSSKIPALGHAEFTVSFSTGALGRLLGSLRIPVEGLDAPREVALEGEVVTEAKLELIHAGEVLASGATLDLGRLAVGAPSARTTVVVKNSGGSPLELSAIELGSDDAFSFAKDPAVPKVLGVGDSFALELVFEPKQGPRKATLRVTSDQGSDYTLEVVGEGLVAVPNVQVSDGGASVAVGGSVSLGSAKVGSAGTTKQLTITNTGDAPLHLSGLSIHGEKDYSLNPASLNQTLAKGESTHISVHFAPTGISPGAAEIRIDSDDPDGAFTFKVVGQAERVIRAMWVPSTPKRYYQLRPEDWRPLVLSAGDHNSPAPTYHISDRAQSQMCWVKVYLDEDDQQTYGVVGGTSIVFTRGGETRGWDQDGNFVWIGFAPVDTQGGSRWVNQGSVSVFGHWAKLTWTT